MTMPAKASRRIEVDGLSYRWRVRRFSHRASVVVIAELEQEPGAVLVAYLGRRWSDPWLAFPDPLPASDRTVPVGPGEVAECIRAARSGGWQPEAHGQPFRLNRHPTA